MTRVNEPGEGVDLASDNLSFAKVNMTGRAAIRANAEALGVFVGNKYAVDTIEAALTKHGNEQWDAAVEAVMTIWADWDSNGLTCQEFINKYQLDMEMETPTLPWLKESIRHLKKSKVNKESERS